MRDPLRFSACANALMASLASRSHEWRAWSLAEEEVFQNGARVCGIYLQIRLRDGSLAVRAVSDAVSPSRVLQEIFSGLIPSGDRWPDWADSLPVVTDAAVPATLAAYRDRRVKGSARLWAELRSKI